MNTDPLSFDGDPLPQFQIDTEFVGLVMAHHARQIYARNMVVTYATNMKKPPPFGVGPTDALMELYRELLWLQDATETSEKLLEAIELKRIQALALLDRVRNGDDLEEEAANEYVKQVVILNGEIEEMTLIMEGMAGA